MTVHVWQAITRQDAGASVTAQDIAAAIRQQLNIELAPELLDKQSLPTAGLHQAALRCSLPGRRNERPMINVFVSDAA